MKIGSKMASVLWASLVLSGSTGCREDASSASETQAAVSHSTISGLSGLATPKDANIVIRPGCSPHVPKFHVSVGQASNEFESGFLLSMRATHEGDYKSAKFFNLDKNELVLVADYDAPWCKFRPKNADGTSSDDRCTAKPVRLTSNHPDFCREFKAVKDFIEESATKGFGCDFKPESRLAPVAKHLQGVFAGKC